STQGAGTWTITWEYWNGSAWTALSSVTDNTTGFTAVAGTYDITYTFPTDWAKTTVNSTTKYFVRARVSAYTSITTRPLGAQSYGYGSIYFPTNNIQLFGVGKASIIKLINSYNADTYLLQDTGHSGIVISDLAVDANQSNQSSGLVYGIYLSTTTTNSRIENCWITGIATGRSGVEFDANKSIMRNCIFSGNHSNSTSLHIMGSDNTITGNVIVGPVATGIYEQNVSNNVISGNSLSSADLRLYGSVYNSITGNKVNGALIFITTNANNNTISGNSVVNSGATAYGISIQNASYNSISSNNFKTTAAPGVYIFSTSTYNNINNNNIQVTGSYGIQELAVADDYNTINSNVINGATVASISPQGVHTSVFGNKTSSATEGIFDIVANSGATQTALSVTQNGTGNIVDFKDGATSVFKISDGGNVTMNGLNFTQNAVNPVHKGAITDSQNVGTYALNGAYSVFVQGKYAYVASLDDSGLEIIDISNPATPVHVSAITDSQNAA
ncbi:MAG TPA: right-handed parallel beta-helix repeat-containing protein, partial [Methylococcales bacterium]